MNNTNKILSAALALLLTGVCAAASLTTTDDSGFLESTNGKKWKRINVSVPASDSDFAFFNIRLECNPDSRELFVDDIGITAIQKSKEHPDSEIKSISIASQFASPVDDWENWVGSTKIKVSVDGLANEVLLPMHEIDLPDQNSGGKPTPATSIRLNPAPARPKEVTTYRGNANGLALKIQSIGMTGLGSPLLAFPKRLSTLIVNQSGLTYGFSFDLSTLAVDLAQSIHKFCGNP